MRNVLIGLLLAGAAATPAIAGPHNWSDPQQAQSDRQHAQNDRQQSQDNRQQGREERQQGHGDARSERSDNRPAYYAPRVDQGSQARPQMYGHQQFDGSQRGGQPADAYARGARDAFQAERNPYAVQQRNDRVEQVRERIDQRQRDVRDARDYRQSGRPGPDLMRDRHPPVVSYTPRPGTQPPLRGDGQRVQELNWNRNWQHDGRHDWRRYRDHHRSLFHLGFYIDPFGWGYQPYGIGYRMWPNYYGNQFWIDPALYGLPYPPEGCAWVRYWNDAVLVDLYTGTVVDEIPGFFW